MSTNKKPRYCGANYCYGPEYPPIPQLPPPPKPPDISRSKEATATATITTETVVETAAYLNFLCLSFLE